MPNIRDETDESWSDIRKVNEAAFGDPNTANLIDALRANRKVHLSLTAEIAGKVVGHILFSSVFVEAAQSSANGAALAPVAVLPEYQRRGVGSALIKEGLKRCRDIGIDYVILLGHTTYYPRFGFEPLSKHGLTSSYGNGEYVMVQELTSGSLRSLSGTIWYQPEFRENGC